MKEVRELTPNIEHLYYDYYENDLILPIIIKREEYFVTTNSKGFLHSFNDNPARITYHGDPKLGKIEWLDYFKDGKYHSLIKAAYQIYGSNGKLYSEEFYIEGKLLSKDEWNKEVNRIKMLNEIEDETTKNN